MMLDILLTNREEVLKAIDAYQAQLANLAGSLEKGDEGELWETLSTIRE
jgi:prephenate dehydrogenase